MSTETYALPWTQSTSDFANSQDIVAKINGTQTVLVAGLLMSVATTSYNFPTDATVEWWITTYHQNGVAKLDSAHANFVAANKATLSPAVPGVATWVKHNP